MEERELLLIVVEPGSQWPTWVENCRKVTPDTVVIVGSHDDTPAELASRTMRRIAALEAHGKRVRTGVLATGDETSDEIYASRSLIARSLLSHMRQAGFGRLLFAAADQMASETRHDLLALTGTLTDQLFGTELSIGVRFGSALPQAQVA
jgi:hypothetical protein